MGLKEAMNQTFADAKVRGAENERAQIIKWLLGEVERYEQLGIDGDREVTILQIVVDAIEEGDHLDTTAD